MYNIFQKVQQCYTDEPIENILQYVWFMTDFFIYFSILDGYPDSQNDVLIKSRVTTDNPVGWNNVLKELGYYYIKNDQIFLPRGRIYEGTGILHLKERPCPPGKNRLGA